MEQEFDGEMEDVPEPEEKEEDEDKKDEEEEEELDRQMVGAGNMELDLFIVLSLIDTPWGGKPEDG